MTDSLKKVLRKQAPMRGRCVYGVGGGEEGADVLGHPHRGLHPGAVSSHLEQINLSSLGQVNEPLFPILLCLDIFIPAVVVLLVYIALCAQGLFFSGDDT